MTGPHPTPRTRPAQGDPQTPGPHATSVTTAVPPRCPTRTRLYRAGALVDEGFPAERISEHLTAHDDTVVWLDLHDPDEADLAILVEEFGLHPLAVEDAVVDEQRPKADRYRTHLFVNLYAVQVRDGGCELLTSEMSAFVTPRALITVRKADFDVDVVETRWDASADLAENGVGFLVHGWLDAVVDGQHRAAQQLDDLADELEEALFDPDHDVDVRRRGFELRTSLAALRRVTVPMREVLARLLRDDEHIRLARPAMVPYFEDVHDHALGAAETVDATRDHVTTILDSYATEQGNELNVITRKLAAWAAIIAVPTAITGWYGQNVPYPGFDQPWGFVSSTSLIVLLAGIIYLMLRRKGWL
ncbi:MAG: magnesium transporter CorA family protein [Pseudonocardia sp.]|uniref:magnesium transporter CorA family protein n=1 Tax=unclassified Pseudonocardia TaxID=2619320 RepID=UPI000AC1527D|nr:MULTISPECIES: magnesium transporter CorA family protein [unclassified Pseudonocardia]MBN9107271.1 magnesium transporter CorA family protein [Pseudonocardia sp.]